MALTVSTHSGSTVANTVLDLSNTLYFANARITNRSTAASPVDLWVRMDGTDPSVAGDNSFFVQANTTRTFSNTSTPTEAAIGAVGTTVCRVISGTICAFEIEFF